MKSNGQRGFSAVEMVITLSILFIASAIALPYLIEYKKSYEFNDYASQIEYLVKYAKIYAMEHTTNVGICVPDDNNKKVSLNDLGLDRSASRCSGTVARKISTDKPYISFAIFGAGDKGPTFDPRGVAIFNGSICVAYSNSKHFKVCIYKTSIRTISGTGGCSSCSE